MSSSTSSKVFGSLVLLVGIAVIGIGCITVAMRLYVAVSAQSPYYPKGSDILLGLAGLGLVAIGMLIAWIGNSFLDE